METKIAIGSPKDADFFNDLAISVALAKGLNPTAWAIMNSLGAASPAEVGASWAEFFSRRLNKGTGLAFGQFVTAFLAATDAAGQKLSCQVLKEQLTGKAPLPKAPRAPRAKKVVQETVTVTCNECKEVMTFTGDPEIIMESILNDDHRCEGCGGLDLQVEGLV